VARRSILIPGRRARRDHLIFIGDTSPSLRVRAGGVMESTGRHEGTPRNIYRVRATLPLAGLETRSRRSGFDETFPFPVIADTRVLGRQAKESINRGERFLYGTGSALAARGGRQVDADCSGSCIGIVLY